MVVFTRGVYSFSRFNCNRELEIKGSLETDDLRVLEISQKCSRLTKYVVEYKEYGM